MKYHSTDVTTSNYHFKLLHYFY